MELTEKNNVPVFLSNYNLFAAMRQRVMSDHVRMQNAFSCGWHEF